MAHHKSALKRIRTSAKRRIVNRENRTKLRSLIKSVRNAENKETAQQALQNTVAFLDKMASKNLIHKNKAANQKSKLTRLVNSMQ